MTNEARPQPKHSLIQVSPSTIIYNDQRYPVNLDKRGASPKFWFNNNKLMFKESPDCFLFGNDMEVLAYRLFESVGLNCAKYSIANYKLGSINHRGVITENFKLDKPDLMEEISGDIILRAYSRRQNKEEFKVNLVNNTINNYLDAIGLIYPETDMEKLRQDLLKLSLADYMVTQTDRHPKNISFLRMGKKLELAPIFDNTFAFCSMNQEKLDNLLKEMPGYTDKEKHQIIHTYSTVRVPMFGISSPVDTTYQFVTYDDYLDAEGYEEECVSEFLRTFEQELALEILVNEELQDLFNKFKQIDIKALIQQINHEEHTIFNDDVAKWISNVFKCRTNALDNIIEKQKSDLSLDMEI